MKHSLISLLIAVTFWGNGGAFTSFATPTILLFGDIEIESWGTNGP